MSDDRAVSHAVGFVLTFGIIIVSAGIVSTVGFNQLNQMKANEQTENSERAMKLLHQNMGEIQRGEAVQRSGELDLNQGSFSTLRPGESRILVNVTGSNDDFHGEFRMAGTQFRIGESTIAYEGGALLRESPAGTTMVRSPTFVCTDDRAIVSVVSVHTDGYRQVSGGTATTKFALNSSTIEFPINRTGPNSTEGKSTVTIRLDSEHAEGWDRYLSSDESNWEPINGAPAYDYECNGASGGGVEQYSVIRTVIDFDVVK